MPESGGGLVGGWVEGTGEQRGEDGVRSRFAGMGNP